MEFATFITSTISATSWTRTMETPAAAHRATVAAVPNILWPGFSADYFTEKALATGSNKHPVAGGDKSVDIFE